MTSRDCDHASVGECSYCTDSRIYVYERLLQECKKRLKKDPNSSDLIAKINKALK